MSDHILVPIDGSDASQDAFEHVRSKHPNDRITLLHVIPPNLPATESDFWHEAEEEKEEQELLAEHGEILSKDGIDVTTAVRNGNPSREIIEYAEENDIDQIIIGSHGRQGPTRVLLGSVAEKVVRRSPVPVNVIR